MAAGDVLAPIARVVRAKELRRVHLAFVSFSISEHATWLAVLFFALQRGGAREVGVVAVAQLAPGVLLTPFSSYAGDRFDPRRALAAGYAVQSLAMVATAFAMAQGHAVAAYVAAAVAATAICFTRPVMGALLPTLTHAPADLVAANVVAGLIEQIGVFVGPIAAGALMAVTSPTAVFVGGALLTGGACALSLSVEGEPVDRDAMRPRAGQAVSELLSGFGVLRRTPLLRGFVLIVVCAGLVKGVGDVIFVTFTDARLDGTPVQSGVLAGAYGIGGLLGAVSVTHLVRARRVTARFLVAAAVLGSGLLGLAIASRMVPAMVCFAMVGGAESALALASIVSIQRVAPTAVLARVFGIVEAVQMGCIAVGSLGITLLAEWFTLGWSFVVLAGLFGVLVLAGVQKLHRHGAAVEPVDAAVVDRLLADPLFAPLPAPTVERLARAAQVVEAAVGDVVIAEGDSGDRYYLVVDGVLDVTVGGRLRARIGRESSFGEIALLRDVPRTATVTAASDVRLCAVGRDEFLEAVTGHSQSFATANRVVSAFLDAD